MALKPEEETKGRKKRVVRRQTTDTAGTGFFGISLNIWPFHERGEYPATKETHDKLNEQATAGRPVRRNQTQKSQ